ncbi:4Fe-4S dicluster domain-containing protein [Desulfatibacillum alkenivorans DSM 16219]|jgi:ferredoxin|uniref:4Fe-4S dicluster domain-containing protein n=1 Tax=Desulfatibacillum alkenivorans DSM 16219 TaxID=1121393 RepID=A0A1M7AE52_9BACT|nr:4Fe-4S binding protein [Desulfatibacillum alkenivorans]SHL40998.1 4Fe-4S dicluster domain-containing protein [Desulfatibacillum alkenivorans DSM 16219]
MPLSESLQKYAKKLGYPNSPTMEKILSILFDTEEKQTIASLLPGSIDNLAGRACMHPQDVERVIKELRFMGAVCRNHRLSGGEEVFELYPGVIELRDAVLLTPGIDYSMVEMWDRIIREELPETIPLWRKYKVPPALRTIPIEKTVDSRSTVLDIESAAAIVENAEQIVVLPCVCRSSRHTLNKSPDCPAPEDAHICMLINRFGEEALERGIGAAVSKEEALAKLKLAEEAGLVHMTRNNIKSDLSLCNCCSCCCTGLFLINQIKYEAFAPSRFRVRLNKEKCLGCGVCVDRCQFHAIELDEVPKVDPDSCFGCGNCVLTCPAEALILEEIRPREFIRST